jgi:hypothetical protein
MPFLSLDTVERAIVSIFHIKTNVNLMKNLRIAKMVSVFSKRSMLACMIAGGILSLNSCDNKDELVTQPQETPEVAISKGVTLKEGRLSFENTDAFKSYRKSLDGKSSKALTTIDKQMGLESHLLDISETLTSSKGARISQDVYQKLEKRVRDPYFASILNKNREVQIGNTIYRCNADYVFEYQKGEEKSIDDFYNQAKSSKIDMPELKEIDFKDIKIARTKINIQKVESKQSNPKARVAFNCEQYWGEDYRMGGEYWTEWYLFFSTAGVSTQMEVQRGWWIFKGWYDEDAEYVRVEADKLGIKFNGIFGWPTFNLIKTGIKVENYNDDVATYVIDWSFGIPGVGDYDWVLGHVTSTAKMYNQVEKNCTFIF